MTRPNQGHQSPRGNTESQKGWGGRDSTPIDLTEIQLQAEQGKALNPELFNTIAHKAAKVIGQNERGNKSTQIRQFYDELVMWEERVMQSPDRFDEFLPFIRMLNAKAAYAKGRNHVDENFVRMMQHCLNQVTNEKTLHHFKRFFEAFLGFYKLEAPKG